MSAFAVAIGCKADIGWCTAYVCPKADIAAPFQNASFCRYDVLSLVAEEAMRRREFITLLGGAAVGWPLVVRAQQPSMPVVGFMSTLSPENISGPVAGFHQGLRETGYREGQNLTIEYRWAQGHYDRLPELAADLVRRRVAVLVASGGDPSPQIAKAAPQTIPIVFGMFGDPVEEGLVDSLSRPGGNSTGVTIFGPAASVGAEKAMTAA